MLTQEVNMLYDVAVVGAGPSGLAASIALACEGKQVALIDKNLYVGGQIAHSHLVENVVGYPRGFNGEEFSNNAHEQAYNLGVDIMLGQQVMLLYGSAGRFSLITPSTTVHSRAVLLALGVSPRPLPFEHASSGCCITNELQLQPAAPGEHVIVYGGGNSAGQAATYYAKCGCTVTILSRRPLVETMDGRWINTMAELGVQSIVGEIQHVGGSVVFESNGVEQSLTAPHTLHVFSGGQPATSWLAVEVNSEGYIVTDSLHNTSTPGIFACGDCEVGTIKRFSCAIGGGSGAVSSISRYLSGLDASKEVVV